MWPAMWNSAFYDDDPMNGPLANEMGIVMSTFTMNRWDKLRKTGNVVEQGNGTITQMLPYA